MIAKPLSVGAVETPEGEVEAQIFTSAVGEEQIRHADDIALCPTLLQECIRSATNVRVTIVDGAITALGLLPPVGEAQEIDIRKHGLASVLYEAITLPRDLANRLLRLLESFQLRFAAIDLLRTRDDRWIFLEVNPNGQWAWMDILGVSDIGSTFVESACKAMR